MDIVIGTVVRRSCRMLHPFAERLHILLGTKPPGQQTANREVGVEFVPVQAKAGTDCNLGDLVVGCLGKALQMTGRYRINGTIGQFDDDLAGRAVISCGTRMGLGFMNDAATLIGSIDLCIGQTSHGFSATRS